MFFQNFQRIRGIINGSIYTLKFNAFKRGIVPSILRNFPGGGMRIFTYEAFKRKFNYYQKPSFYKSFICAGIGGSVGILFGTPGDILKVRMINDLNGVKYKSSI